MLRWIVLLCRLITMWLMVVMLYVPAPLGLPLLADGITSRAQFGLPPSRTHSRKSPGKSEAEKSLSMPRKNERVHLVGVVRR